MNAKVKEQWFDIVAGPNRDMLFDVCKYAYAKAVKLTVIFEVAIAYTMPKDDPGCTYIPMSITDIKITGIEHEDGSGESFNLHGYCKADLESFREEAAKYKPYRFKAYYNSRQRKGAICFIE